MLYPEGLLLKADSVAGGQFIMERIRGIYITKKNELQARIDNVSAKVGYH